MSRKDGNTGGRLSFVEKAWTHRARKSMIFAALLCAAVIGFSGCAGGYYEGGYSSAYYAPDYGPYYADYGYGGYPYWGTGPYAGGAIIIGGIRHPGYYGGHHFIHEGGRGRNFGSGMHLGGRSHH